MTCLYPMLVDAPARGLCRGCGGPLKRNKDGGISKVYKWCSDVCSEAYAINHHWAWARNYAMRLNRKKYPDRWKETCEHCKQRIEGSPEVNHIYPRYGEGYGTGCWHHQDNLEVLDHDCHVAVTQLQRDARKRGGQMALEE